MLVARGLVGLRAASAEAQAAGSPVRTVLADVADPQACEAVAARAVRFAADHPGRREYWVGGSTVGTLVANALAPGLLDRYLARAGIGAQQEDGPRQADGLANLWTPSDTSDDHGAHGRFDDEARERSTQLWASQHHGLLAVGGAALLGAAARGLARGSRSGPPGPG
ncbi:hypothetical protein ACGF13_20405 [Kitasatospora sp. NPDC048286]|uniref:hypothetical protein n=1 Tax=Kitasatospora sp. NPDC048286 TaxID=3364047 RepID=UPI00371146A3